MHSRMKNGGANIYAPLEQVCRAVDVIINSAVVAGAS